jgi:hypothetical protein
MFKDLINMMLLSYPESPQSSQTFYSGQQKIQIALLGVAVLCIPWMLLGKPIYIIMKNRRRTNVKLTFQKYLLITFIFFVKVFSSNNRWSIKSY